MKQSEFDKLCVFVNEALVSDKISGSFYKKFDELMDSFELEDRKPCPDCKGTGKLTEGEIGIMNFCFTCMGTGEVE
jgi:DnaJ-class molecular chaperone